jgi:Sulfotransferase family
VSAGEGHRFVFVAGLHRSGTTLLARLLAAHPEISGFSGTGAPADEGQHLQSVYPSDHEYGRPGRFGFAPEMHLTESSPLASEESARSLFAEWSPHWDLSRPLLLEKSPPNLIKTRFLQALFPESAFIVVVRHPIPVSIPTAKWRGTRRYDRLLDHWLHCYALFEADREHLGRVHVLTYEQLVGDPAVVLEETCEFLEIEPIAPSEPVETGANEKYFRRWKDLKRDPRMRAYLDLVSLKYERRVRPYGYSLLRPVPSKPLPVWACVSGSPSGPTQSVSLPRRALRTRKAAAAALGAAAVVAGAGYVGLGSPGLGTHRNIRPTSARSRACESDSERLRVEPCGPVARNHT